MSEMKQIVNCLSEMQGQIAQINNKLSQVDAKIEQMDTKIAQMDKRIYSLEERVGSLDERVSSLDKKMEKGFAEIKQEFDEKLSLVEFGLDAEIQKVYEIALDNQAGIERIRIQQSNYQIDGIARQQVAEVTDRVDVVESVVQSHSEAIHKLQDAIA